MSLIQDALKRQHEESGSMRVPLKTAPVRPPVAPEAQLLQAGNTEATATAGGVVPDTMPIRPGPEPADRPLPEVRPAAIISPAGPAKPAPAGRSWKLIAGIIILCILVAWGGGLLVVSYRRHLAELALPGPFGSDLTKAQATPGKASVPAPPPEAQPAVIPAPALEKVSGPLFSSAAVAAPAFMDEGEDVEEDMALPSVNKPELPVIMPRPAPHVWPRLKLSAIFSNVGSGQAGARLNNRLILRGNQIDGVILVEIRRDSVVLKYGEEIRALKMGATLN